MARDFRLMLCSVLLAGLFMVTVTGCGGQTKEANRLVEEGNLLIEELNPRLSNAQRLMEQGAEYLDFGEIEKGKEMLNTGKADIDAARRDLEKARAKYEEAVSLDIGDNHRRYLEAVVRSTDADIRSTEILVKMAQLRLADPEMANPATATETQALKKEIDYQEQLSEEAGAEAGRIADEHADEFKDR